MNRIALIVFLVFVLIANIYNHDKQIQNYENELSAIKDIALERNGKYEDVLDNIVKEISRFEKDGF
ncbi:TPA: hypothetical protein CPT79_01920 [Candidatus Gastranaerophilales bacterium HUM_6]|jgi:uncharacterized linocin/CFP29 family protein|nr:hypothetical protein [Cyanobacteriota bacterium]CDE93205.1 unknown [Fusobacterium sp. CAG:815]DAA93211.1 MAG TPA: hypothetical protein CPT79_01920 [Candidatus Gastranaerophilales bacterium HUM_6]DAA93524.1 MAG TPA: hypothetical protein CPT93_03555 [Candidatus Gastranaerophilales bacterium HUM_7]DAB02744.1 MAG TPA: hypothetical protein CPT84_03865 [Candidatus Gastranaerophilales bacterium HUM_12]DAB06439.1 MAG TPA: hypothetical protein CPT78_04600 [Candidatus Gastranaerophilales bacterium HU